MRRTKTTTPKPTPEPLPRDVQLLMAEKELQAAIAAICEKYQCDARFHVGDVRLMLTERQG